MNRSIQAEGTKVETSVWNGYKETFALYLVSCEWNVGMVELV